MALKNNDFGLFSSSTGGGGGGVSGNGTATQVAFWDTSSSISSDADLYWDNVNKRLGVGNINPEVKLHVGDAGGVMGFPYEEAVVEKAGDTKMGVYTSASAPNLGGASYALGYTNFLTGSSLYPGFEFQMVGNNVVADNLIRYNFLERDASGIVQANNTGIFNLYADSRISFKTLVGTGTEMVVSDSSGFISRQALPVPYTGATQDVDLGNFGINAEYFELNTTTPYTPAVARMGWNPDYGTYDLTFGDGTVNNIGQQLEYPPCVNKTLSSLPYGCCVMADPSNPVQGNDVSVIRMISNGTYPAKLFLGLLTTTVAPDGIGHVCWFGDLLNININNINLGGETWAEGNILYPDPINQGGLTNVQPDAPNIDIAVCIIKKISGINIDLLVRPSITPDMGELNDVYVPSPSNNDVIAWNTANSRYENNNVATLLGQATSSANGYLSSTDWTRFANFQILSGYQLLGSAFKSILMSNPSISNLTQPINLATGQLRLVSVYVPIAQSIQGVKWLQSVQGAFTGSGYNGVALFSYSGGTLTRIALSTDSEATWETFAANTWGNVAFTAPVSISEGIYYVGLLFNGGATAPGIYGTVNSGNANVNIGDFTNSAKLNLTLGSQTSMPSSVSMSGAGVAVSANNPGVYLY